MAKPKKKTQKNNPKNNSGMVSAEPEKLDPDTASEAINVLIVGVGGQGVIMVSKVLARICQNLGYQVKQSEVHGMAKRGGVVFSHVRFGKEVWSPTIPAGKADVLIALEWAEGLRWMNFLRPDSGIFIADTKRIVPPFACRSRVLGADIGYSKDTPKDVREKIAEAFALDATEMARKAGNEQAANTLLLGALSTALTFPDQAWKDVIAEMVPPKTIEVNLKVFDQGQRWIDGSRKGEPVEGAAFVPLVQPEKNNVRTTLEIVEEWCKGCDICVKMCPERCLVLNKNQVAELEDPEKCTGCHICEWLCPDFAISLNPISQEAVA
ncbi:Indolepyruvate oxidoreductase subunit IorB / 2-oxoglutarate/2-oxoacid ferredoxin oxidoreductase, delta subunit, ferredoxin-like 4Fe-4S binding protein [hydrothermal vent metagenome]|uniref:Indolepyruvate oxidoreductase subunit IorB / 2-oxoglutarate/2-oxoacid ferredoxin oxidoreductase, delta subunit, ferredoxin-like 4Fe-4S binding protein n=1 Tax=hydrothermal vent metagenome TaxID=652676 RepID=A0A3B0SMS6_9ZZZZ